MVRATGEFSASTIVSPTPPLAGAGFAAPRAGAPAAGAAASSRSSFSLALSLSIALAYFCTCGVAKQPRSSSSESGPMREPGGTSRVAKGGVGTPFGPSTETRAAVVGPDKQPPPLPGENKQPAEKGPAPAEKKQPVTPTETKKGEGR